MVPRFGGYASDGGDPGDLREPAQGTVAAAVTRMEGSYPKAYLYRRVVQAKLFIDAHFSEEIDVDDISSEAAFSKFHFIRLFKSVYGLAPHAYLTTVRVQQA